MTASNDDALAPADRRAWVRYRCERPSMGRVFVASSYLSVSAVVVDLSVGGIGLLLEQSFEAGTLLRVELDGPSEIVAEVKNSVPQPDGKWRCGCELVWKLTEDEVRFLLK